MLNPEDRKPNALSSSFFKAFRDAGPFFGLGIQLAAAVVIMFFIGKWLDGKWNSSPWMVILCTLFGAVAGIYQFVKIVNRINRRESNSNKKTER